MLCCLQVATEAEVFVFDLPTVTRLPGFSACAAGFLAAAVPLKLGVGVAEDLKLLARCFDLLEFFAVEHHSTGRCRFLFPETVSFDVGDSISMRRR